LDPAQSRHPLPESSPPTAGIGTPIPPHGPRGVLPQQSAPPAVPEINGMYTPDAQAMDDFEGRPGAMPDGMLDRYPVAPKNCRKTGCISIICSRPIASYNWIMMPTESKTPVPEAFPTVPIMSAPAARA